LQVKDDVARAWYEKEEYEQTWSVRTLQRNVNKQYYYQMLQSQNKELVEQELKEEIEIQKAMFYLRQKEKENG
jgi:predicted nuclease of restriction endonuclease-like (RecB) superfamily